MRKDAAQRLAARAWVYEGVLVTGGRDLEVVRSVREQLLPYLTVARKVSFRVDTGIPYIGD